MHPAALSPNQKGNKREGNIDYEREMSVACAVDDKTVLLQHTRTHNEPSQSRNPFFLYLNSPTVLPPFLYLFQG